MDQSTLERQLPLSTESIVDAVGSGTSPAAKWDRDVAKRALDELFSHAGRYRSSKEYDELMAFLRLFRSYAPFNAMLLHTQMPGARYVAPAHRWRSQYGRRVKPNARPLVILQPMGPVMFVFDVSDTEPMDGAPALPPEVERPFEVYGRKIGSELGWTIENAKRDGIRVYDQQAGSQSAGSIRTTAGGSTLQVQVRERPEPQFITVPLRYQLLLNADHETEARYATLVHELAHLYCGHLGTPNPRWWPDRRGLSTDIEEFEAESVCHLVCRRLGILTRSDQYLSGYLDAHDEIPPISLDRVLVAARMIEEMGMNRLPPRKEPRQ